MNFILKVIFTSLFFIISLVTLEARFAPSDIQINYSDDEFEDDESNEEEQENEEIEENI